MKVRNLIGIKAVESFQLLPLYFRRTFRQLPMKVPRNSLPPDLNAVVTPLLDTVRKLWSCVIREMRILFGMVLTVLRGRRINENMVWTDSQDYGADEILYTT